MEDGSLIYRGMKPAVTKDVGEELSVTSFFRISIAGGDSRSGQFNATSASKVSIEMDPMVLRQGGTTQSMSVRHLSQVTRLRVELPVTAGRAPVIDKWWRETTDSSKTLSKRVIDITQIDREGNELRSWRLKNAWPCKIGLSPLTKQHLTATLTEFYEFVYEGIEEIRPRRQSSHTLKDDDNADSRSRSNKEMLKNRKVNRSPETRKRFLREWYRENHGYRQQKAASHVKGSNLNDPLTIKRFFPGENLEQHVVSGRTPGMYNAYPGSSPESLGIQPGGRVAQSYVVIRPGLEAVETTAASFPAGKLPGIGGPGGARQLIMPKGWLNYVKPIR